MQYSNQNRVPDKNKLQRSTHNVHYALNILRSLHDISCNNFSNIPLQPMPLRAPLGKTLQAYSPKFFV